MFYAKNIFSWLSVLNLNIPFQTHQLYVENICFLYCNTDTVQRANKEKETRSIKNIKLLSRSQESSRSQYNFLAGNSWIFVCPEMSTEVKESTFKRLYIYSFKDTNKIESIFLRPKVMNTSISVRPSIYPCIYVCVLFDVVNILSDKRIVSICVRRLCVCAKFSRQFFSLSKYRLPSAIQLLQY